MSEEELETTEEIQDPKAVLAALDRAKKDAEKWRKEVDALKSTPGEDKFKDRAMKAEIKNTLHDSGVKNVDRILKHMSLDGIDFDDDGNLVGLESKMKELRDDIPELFDVKKRAGAIDQFKEGAITKEMTASEKQAAYIQGGL
jgi:minor structural protein GP20